MQIGPSLRNDSWVEGEEIWQAGSKSDPETTGD